MTRSTTQTPRNRGPLLLLAGLFLVPLVLAFVLYYGTGWRPAGSTRHGDLLDPARPLAEVSLVRADGQPTGSGFLRGRWTLLYVGAGTCGPTCRQALVDTRQMRLALDRQASRVQRVFLHAGALHATQELLSQHPDLLAARVDGPAGEALLRPFPRFDTLPPVAANRIYVVDPLGNLVLSYAPQADRRGMLKDLRQLLKLSHIG